MNSDRAAVRVVVMGSTSWTDRRAVARVLQDITNRLRAEHPGAQLLLVGGGERCGVDPIAQKQAGALGWKVERRHALPNRPCPPACPPQHRYYRPDGTNCCPDAWTRRDEAVIRDGAVLAVLFDAGEDGAVARLARLAALAGIPVELVQPRQPVTSS